MNTRIKIALLAPSLLVSLATLAGCGLNPASIPGRMDSSPASQAGTRAHAFDPQTRRVVLRIPGSILLMAEDRRRTWLAEESRRNAEQGPFSREMIGGMYPGPNLPTYVVEGDPSRPGSGTNTDLALHVSADGFKTELEELTYKNHRERTPSNDLLVPYWDRPGKSVSYYFTYTARKIARPGVAAPTVQLPTQYVSNLGKNFQGDLE